MTAIDPRLALALIALPACAPKPPEPDRRPLAITNVSVVDPTEGRVTPGGLTVVVEGSRIRSVRPAAETQSSDSVRVVDGSGKFLLPGLWDMHVHGSLDRHFTLPMMVAHGVTGIREMFGRGLETVLALRGQVEAGRVLGPEIVTSGPIVDGEGAFWPGSAVVRDEAAARAAVRDQAARGADFVKVYSALSRAAYFAIADEARKAGIPFAGHVPDLVSLDEASAAGQASIEHLNGILGAGSTDERRLLTELADSAARPGGRKKVQALLNGRRASLAAGFDSVRAESVFARLAANRTWQVPTLTVALVGADPLNPALDSDPDLRYVPYLLSGMWTTVRRFAGSDTSTERKTVNRRIYQLQRWSVGAMSRAGVPILAGTDTPNPFTIPGSSLHHELELLVEAGLKPADAIRAATLAPAEFLGATDSLGTVEPGKVANLVLLDANPLDDIRNSRRISAVVLRGRLFGRAALDSILTEVGNQRWRPSDAGLTLLGVMLSMIPPGIRIGVLVLVIAPIILLVRRVRRRSRRRA